MSRNALDQLIAILESAWRRPQNYFGPIEPVVVIHWLHGLRVGALLAGLEWSPSHRQPEESHDGNLDTVADDGARFVCEVPRLNAMRRRTVVEDDSNWLKSAVIDCPECESGIV